MHILENYEESIVTVKHSVHLYRQIHVYIHVYRQNTYVIWMIIYEILKLPRASFLLLH
jgi:hypothetical protein